MNIPDKKTIRRVCSFLRRELEPEVRKAADAAINASLADLPEVSGATHVGAYLSDGCEVDLGVLLAKCLADGKCIYVPRCCSDSGAEYEMVRIRDLSRELTVGRYGLLEPKCELPGVPADERRGMTWLIPGVAFDRSGTRLGRGKGIYDRLLQGETGSKIGVFYSVQECRELPAECHDMPLDMAVTELEVIRY